MSHLDCLRLPDRKCPNRGHIEEREEGHVSRACPVEEAENVRILLDREGHL